MSENNERVDFVDMSHAPASDTDTRGPGEALRNARFALNLSESQVAEQLYLSKRTVLALEHDDYAKLPGLAFIKGYVRAYARIVNLPADELVAKIDALHLREPTLSPALASSVTQKSSFDRQVNTRRYITVAGLALIVLLFFMWWQGQRALNAEEAAGFAEAAIESNSVVTEQQYTVKPEAEVAKQESSLSSQFVNREPTTNTPRVVKKIQPALPG